MKEEWKVFIWGNKDRGEEVIKALMDLGAINPWNYAGDSTNVIYYIGYNGYIDFVNYREELAQIIMDDYREIKLSEQWKDGDIIFSPKFGSFAVYGYDGSDNPIAVYCHVTKTDIISYPTRVMRCDYRLATPEEIEQFRELLHKHYKNWDVKNKQLMDWKWKPECGENYFYVTSLGEVKESMLDQEGVKTVLDFGNYFCTKEEAEAMAEKIKNLLKDNL